MNRGAKVVKGYLLVGTDGRSLQELRAGNRETARKFARRFARSYDADCTLIEIREGKPAFLVEAYRRQARESLV